MVFNTDFRFWTPAVKTFNAEKMLYFLPYLPAFFAFYLGNSLIVNSAGGLEKISEKKNYGYMHLQILSDVFSFGQSSIFLYSLAAKSLLKASG